MRGILGDVYDSQKRVLAELAAPGAPTIAWSEVSRSRVLQCDKQLCCHLSPDWGSRLFPQLALKRPRSLLAASPLPVAAPVLRSMAENGAFALPCAASTCPAGPYSVQALRPPGQPRAAVRPHVLPLYAGGAAARDSDEVTA